MIRKANVKDVPILHKLLEQIAKVHQELYPGRFESGVKYSHKEIENLVLDSKTLIWVQEETEVVGYIIVKIEGKDLFVDDLCVDEKFRGHGYGEQLMMHVEEYAKAKDYVTILLNVWNRNIGALNFYERQGFRPLKTLVYKEVNPK